jgi:hypothetical protein
MLTNDQIRGSGFTLIVDDQTTDERSQESINEMFQDLRNVLNDHGFDISIVADQEDAMKFQARILYKRMYNALEKLALQEED